MLQWLSVWHSCSQINVMLKIWMLVVQLESATFYNNPGEIILEKSWRNNWNKIRVLLLRFWNLHSSGVAIFTVLQIAIHHSLQLGCSGEWQSINSLPKKTLTPLSHYGQLKWGDWAMRHACWDIPDLDTPSTVHLDLLYQKLLVVIQENPLQQQRLTPAGV